MKLSDYINGTRLLLHDARINYYTDADLTLYINKARCRVAADSGCYRIMRPVTLTAGTETYPLTYIPLFGASAGQINSVMNIFVIWSNIRYKLRPCSWMEFNQKYRVYTTATYSDVPMAYSQLSQTIYLAPVPDAAYVAEFDLSLVPEDLVDDSDYDTSVIPLSLEFPVQLYAAHLAKMYDQSIDEARALFAMYAQHMVMNAMSPINRRA